MTLSLRRSVRCPEGYRTSTDDRSIRGRRKTVQDAGEGGTSERSYYYRNVFLKLDETLKPLIIGGDKQKVEDRMAGHRAFSH